MNKISMLWVLVALGFLIFEMGHPGLFFFLSFSFAAIATAVLTFFLIDSYEYQALFFLVSSAVAWYVLYRFIGIMRVNQEKSNVAALVGRKVLVVQDIYPNRPGAVTFDGSVWTAYVHNEVCIKGTIVIIQVVRGAHVVVVPVKSTVF